MADHNPSEFVPRPGPADDSSSMSQETRRRQKIIDLARRGTHRAGHVTVGRSRHDQHAWVSGQITLDELVALSQSRTTHAPASAHAGSSDVDAATARVKTSEAPSVDVAAHDLELLAVVTAAVTKEAVAAAATTALEAAGAARAAQSAAAAKLALATAETVRQAADLLRAHADDDADRINRAAAEAASLVALAVLPGTEAVQAARAASLAATNRAAAATKAEETAVAAAIVARAAAAAATGAAATAADAARALALQVADTAAAVEAVATAAARRVALDTITAADLVLANSRQSRRL